MFMLANLVVLWKMNLLFLLFKDWRSKNMFVEMVFKEFKRAHECPIFSVFQFKDTLLKHHDVQITSKIIIHGIPSPSYKL